MFGDDFWDDLWDVVELDEADRQAQERREQEETAYQRRAEAEKQRRINVARGIKEILDAGGDPTSQYGPDWRRDYDEYSEIEKTGFFFYEGY